MAKTFKPPEAVAKEARQAREWKKKHDLEHGTRVGWTRSSQLADRKPVSLETIKRMRSFFNRHAGNQKLNKSKWKDTPWKDAGLVMWKAWGGDPGRKWAKEIIERQKK